MPKLNNASASEEASIGKANEGAFEFVARGLFSSCILLQDLKHCALGKKKIPFCIQVLAVRCGAVAHKFSGAQWDCKMHQVAKKQGKGDTASKASKSLNSCAICPPPICFPSLLWASLWCLDPKESQPARHLKEDFDLMSSCPFPKRIQDKNGVLFESFEMQASRHCPFSVHFISFIALLQCINCMCCPPIPVHTSRCRFTRAGRLVARSKYVCMSVCICVCVPV